MVLGGVDCTSLAPTIELSVLLLALMALLEVLVLVVVVPIKDWIGSDGHGCKYAEIATFLVKIKGR